MIDKISQERLDTLHPYVKYLGEQFFKKAEAAGFKIKITQGLRTIEYQNELYAQGRTTPGPIVTQVKGGYSIHNFGYAFDIVILNPNYPDGLDYTDSHYLPLGQIGESLGLEWGGRWTSFIDAPHFQYTQGISTARFRDGERPECPPIPKEVEVIEERDGYDMKFNEEYYLAANPDVAQAVREKRLSSGKEHYDNWGKDEVDEHGNHTRFPYPQLPHDFNEGIYLRDANIAKAVNNGDFASGAEHWQIFGWKENRIYSEAQINKKENA